MTTYRTNCRRNYQCEVDQRRAQNGAIYNSNDMYIDEPPVRDPNSVYKPRVYRDVLEPSYSKEIPERDIQRQNGIPHSPGSCPIGPPPMGRYDLWDLRFDRWWGWNWVKRQQQPPPEVMPVPVTRTTPYPQLNCCSMCCLSLRNFCKRLCCFDSPCDNRAGIGRQHLQRLYNTPSNSYVATDPLMIDRCPCPQMERYHSPQPYSPEAVIRSSPVEPPCEICYPVNKPRRQIRKEEERQGQSWVREKSSSTSSEECPCSLEAMKVKTSSNDYLQYLASRLNQINSNGCCHCINSSFMNSCCPCEQNICCSCAQNILTQKSEKPKKPKKKKKTCNCSTQTKQELKDKNTGTTSTRVCDACVCCKPKKPKTCTRNTCPPPKVCCICRRPNVCPPRCCPCFMPPVCCPCDVNYKKVNNDNDNDTNTNEAETSSAKDSDVCCISTTKESKETTKKKSKSCKCKRKINSDSKTELLAPEETCTFNAELFNFNENSSWLEDICKQKNTFSKSIPSKLSWLNEFLAKSPTHKWQKQFKDDKYFSPFTGNVYDLNTLKFKQSKKRKYKFYEPMEQDESVDVIKAAANQVKGDKEHRQLLTSVCDAILANKSKHGSIECGDSSFLDEFTYPSCINTYWNQITPLNLYTNSIFNSTCFSQNTTNNFSNFTQTENVFNDILSRNATSVNKPNNETFEDRLFRTQHTITDPINSLFNEKTHNEVDELFTRYLEGLKTAKMFVAQTTEACQNETEGRTISAQTDIPALQSKYKSSFMQCKGSESEPEDTSLQANIPNEEGLDTRKDLKSKQTTKTKIENKSEIKNETNIKIPNNQKEVDCETQHHTTGNTDTEPDISSKDITIKNDEINETDIHTPGNTKRKTEKANNFKIEIIKRSADSYHHCCSGVEQDITELPIRSPRNLKQQDLTKKIQSVPSHQHKKRPAIAFNITAKKKRLEVRGSRENCSNSNEEQNSSTNFSSSEKSKASNYNKKFKSKIPVTCAPGKPESKYNKDIALKRYQFYKQLTSAGNPGITRVDCFANAENVYIATEYDNKESKPLFYNSKMRDAIDRNDTFNNFNIFNNDDEKSESQSLCSSPSKEEIILASIKYDTEENDSADDMLTSDDFAPNVPTDKSVLSIIKEETESDINVSTSTCDFTNFLDINTSPFDFEYDRLTYVDSCNSPFEMKRARRLSLGLLCFSSQEKDSEPYGSSGNETSSTTLSAKNTEKSTHKEKRWFSRNNQ